MQCMVAMSRVDNAMLSAQFEFVQAKSNGGGENRACTQCFIILHAPTFVWHAWCPSQIRRALEELKGLLPIEASNNLTFSTDQIPEPRNKGALLDTCNTHWSTQRLQEIQTIQKIRKSECLAWTGKKNMGWQGFNVSRRKFHVAFRESFMFPSLPQPIRMQRRDSRLIPSEVCRLYLDEPCRRITMLESLKQKMSASKLEYGGNPWVSCHFMELLVVWLFACINYTTILQQFCHTSGSPHPEGPWGCDASYCLKQLQTIQSNPWSTDGLIGFFYVFLPRPSQWGYI